MFRLNIFGRKHEGRKASYEENEVRRLPEAGAWRFSVKGEIAYITGRQRCFSFNKREKNARRGRRGSVRHAKGGVIDVQLQIGNPNPELND